MTSIGLVCKVIVVVCLFSSQLYMRFVIIHYSSPGLFASSIRAFLSSLFIVYDFSGVQKSWGLSPMQ